MGWLRFWKNHIRGDQDFHVKMGEGVIYIGKGGGGEKCFSLMMYGFCSNNALY